MCKGCQKKWLENIGMQRKVNQCFTKVTRVRLSKWGCFAGKHGKLLMVLIAKVSFIWSLMRNSTCRLGVHVRSWGIRGWIRDEQYVSYDVMGLYMGAIGIHSITHNEAPMRFCSCDRGRMFCSVFGYWEFWRMNHKTKIAKCFGHSRSMNHTWHYAISYLPSPFAVPPETNAPWTTTPICIICTVYEFLFLDAQSQGKFYLSILILLLRNSCIKRWVFHVLWNGMISTVGRWLLDYMDAM